MKKIIGTLVIIIGLSSTCFSQFTKGKVLAGGSFSTNFNSYNYGGVSAKSTSIDFFPQVGYFVANNMAVGAGLSLSYSKSTPGNISGAITSTSFSFSPFARYYIQKFFGQATFGLGTQTPLNSTIKLKNSSWALSAGYAYMLNEHVAIEPQIGYETNYLKQDSGSKTTNGNLFLKVGIQVYLGK